MKRTIILYASVLCIAVFLLEWMEYRYITRSLVTEIYVVLLVTAFSALGVWVGRRLTSTQQNFKFECNKAALKSLGLTGREHEVLKLMALGQSNKEIARKLSVSPNTVKTHVTNLFHKLGAGSRIEAINEARLLHIIP